MVACRTWIVGGMALLYFAISIVLADSGVSRSTVLQFIHRLIANSVSLDPSSACLKLLGICRERAYADD